MEEDRMLDLERSLGSKLSIAMALLLVTGKGAGLDKSGLPVSTSKEGKKENMAKPVMT